jgi:bifunctional non-homologous end joining protein LigD
VPKGISLDPKIKRLAMLTEDHPLDYLLFEDVIPEGNYGAGTVIDWDTGTYETKEDISEQFKRGKITFSLFGQKLSGKFKLIKIRSKEEEENQWLLMKLADESESEEDLTINRPESVLTGRTNDDLETGKNEDKTNRNRTIKGKSPIKKQVVKTQAAYANKLIQLKPSSKRKDFPSRSSQCYQHWWINHLTAKNGFLKLNGMECVQFYFFISRRQY